MPLNTDLTIRCAVLNANGEEVTSLSRLRLRLVPLTRRDEDLGPDANFGSSSTTVRFSREGDKAFRCEVRRPVRRMRFETSTLVIRAVPQTVEDMEIAFLDSNLQPRDRFEIGEPFNILIRAFFDEARLTLITPQTVDVTFASGRYSCDTVVRPAQGIFRKGRGKSSTEAKAEGIDASSIQKWSGNTLGNYTAFVRYSDGQSGVLKCASRILDVVKDAKPPEIRIVRPAETQIRFTDSASNLRIEGTVADTGSGIARVIVNNGDDTVKARLYSVSGRSSKKRFVAELPYRPGLHLVTVTASDRSGRRARDAGAYVIGQSFMPLARQAGPDSVRGQEDLQQRLKS